MIRTHGEGSVLHEKYRSQYELELELICINSEFEDSLNIKKSLEKAKLLVQEYPDQVILKESEFHEENSPYYEVSVYCYNKDKNKFIQAIEDIGLKIDLINETKDYY